MQTRGYRIVIAFLVLALSIATFFAILPRDRGGIDDDIERVQRLTERNAELERELAESERLLGDARAKLDGLTEQLRVSAETITGASNGIDRIEDIVGTIKNRGALVAH